MSEVTAMRNNALPYPVYGLPFTITFPFLDADGDPVAGASTPDAEISKNGDTFADCTNESTEIATSSGVYYLTLTGTELTTDIATIIGKSATSGMKTTVATLYPRKLATLRSGTTQGGSSTTIQFDSGASAIDDFYNGMVVSASLDGTTEVRLITDYVGSTKTATVHVAWISGDPGPDSNDTFIIYQPAECDARAKAVLPDNAPGAANGLLISGSNSGTTTVGALTITGAMSINGTGMVAQTGDCYPKIDTEVAAILAAVDTEIADIQSRLPAALGANGNMKSDVRDFSGTAGTFAGGRPEVNATHWLGTGILTPSTAGTPDVNVRRWNNGTTAITNFNTVFSTDFSNNYNTSAPGWKASLGYILGTALTETSAGYLAAGFKKQYDVATPVFTAASVNQTGDNYPRLGAPAGASLAADIAAVKTDTGNIYSAVDTEVAAILAAVDTEVAAIVAAIGTPSNLGSGATLSANLADIEAQTDDIGTAGAGLTAIPWNPSWDAEVQSEVDDALKAGLTESYRAHGATGSVAEMLYELLAHHGASANIGTTKTLYKLDGTTPAKTYTYDNASNPTSIAMAS